MARIKTLLQILQVLRRNPRSLIKVLDEENVKMPYVVEHYSLRNGLPVIDLSDLFPGFKETIEPYSCLEGAAAPSDVGLLKALARKYDHCRYLEIGTWRGESAANVAQVAEECVTIDLSPREMGRRGLSDSYVKNQAFFSKSLKNVTHIRQNSRSLDFANLGKFDLVFIDGDHSYEGVKVDTRNAFTVLRDSDSVIVWHDYGFTPEIIRWCTLAGILDGCPEVYRNNLYHISNTMCAIFMRGRLNAHFVTYPSIPNKSFKIEVSVTGV